MSSKAVRLALTIAAVLIAACNDSGSSGGSGTTNPASFTQHHFAEGDLPERDYFLYVPASLPANAPLVVYLHGCNQNATDAAVGTRWNELAEIRGFVVAYPQQKNPNNQAAETPEEIQAQYEDHLFDGNGVDCWNWFRPEHIMRDTGEAGTIAGITREVMARSDIDIDPDRVYVMGLSAGGIMASTMGVAYPDLYAAVGIAAGCGYPACSDPGGSLAYQVMGENARRLPVIVFHGTADEIAPFPMGEDAVRQWLGTNDWFDNGQPDGSVSPFPAQTIHFGLDESAVGGLGNEGDTCIRNENSPCIGGVLGSQSYPFTIERYADANNCPLIDFWIIHGLAHNYPGGNPEGNFVDPLGPNITIGAYNFFLANRKDSEFETGRVDCSGLFPSNSPL